MNRLLGSLLCMTVIATSVTNASVGELLIDNRRPLPVTLNDAERVIQFDGPVAFAARDVSGVYRLSDYLSFQNLDAAVLIDPIRAFPPLRVEVMRRDIERRYLLDLRFVDGKAALGDVIVTDRVAPESTAMQPVPESPPCLSADCITDPRALLIRFAAQTFYGPKALVTSLPGVTASIPPSTASLGYNDDVALVSLGRWHWRNYRLDAVQIANTCDQPLILDPRKLLGLSPDAVVSAQRWSLSPAGQAGDTTTLYLVQSERR